MTAELERRGVRLLGMSAAPAGERVPHVFVIGPDKGIELAHPMTGELDALLRAVDSLRLPERPRRTSLPYVRVLPHPS
jgi:hypothetical protein